MARHPCPTAQTRVLGATHKHGRKKSNTMTPIGFEVLPPIGRHPRSLEKINLLSSGAMSHTSFASRTEFIWIRSSLAIGYGNAFFYLQKKKVSMQMRNSVVNKHLDIPFTDANCTSFLCITAWIHLYGRVDENLVYNISIEILLVHHYEFSFFHNSSHCSLFSDYYDVSTW